MRSSSPRRAPATLTVLLVILAFSLSGYLLPWDQKAYWATTVTINIAHGSRSGSASLELRTWR